MIIKILVEKAARNKILKRRLPKRFGHSPLYISPDSQLKYLKIGDKAFDEELLKVAHNYIKDDSLVWDIGANVGVFTFAAASIAKSGKILAIEADIWLAQLISKSSRLKENRSRDISVLHAAISDSNGIATFLIAEKGRASSSLEISKGRTTMGGVREKVLVTTLTLDTLLDFFFHPTVLKIDVEGAESLVIDGAPRLLREIRPIVYIEVGSASIEKITSIFLANNYSLLDGKTLQPVSKCTYNTVAIPNEKIPSVQ